MLSSTDTSRCATPDVEVVRPRLKGNPSNVSLSLQGVADIAVHTESLGTLREQRDSCASDSSDNRLYDLANA
jgi:hypothetical protein